MTQRKVIDEVDAAIKHLGESIGYLEAAIRTDKRDDPRLAGRELDILLEQVIDVRTQCGTLRTRIDSEQIPPKQA